MRADVEDNRLCLDRAGGVDRRPHRFDALRVDRVIRRSKVDEVESVHEGRDPHLLAPRAELLQIGGVVVRKSPRAGALSEELKRLRARPARCTSGVSGPPCSTGYSPATAAANSSSGSRTPTRAARSRAPSTP